VSDTKPREIGRLWLPRQSRDWGHGGGPASPRTKNANLILSVQPGSVLLSVSFEEVVLDVEARDQFARLWMDAERAAEAQAGATP
jgi:hypothetical protein